MTPKTCATGRLVSIDVLRGVAVLAVLMRHLPFSLKLGPNDPAINPFGEWTMALAHYGEYGVHLFLVISGFCIHQRWARRGDLEAKIDFGSFWRRRLHRLYPPYMVALLISLAGLFAMYGVLGTPKTGGVAGYFGYDSISSFSLDLLLLILLAQNLNGASQRVGNGPFWSLALEEQLYMLYFPLLWVRRRFGWSLVLAMTFAVSTIWRISGVVLFERPPVFWYIVGPAHWFEWGLGALAVEAYLGHVKLPAWTSKVPAAVVLLAMAVVLDLPEPLHYQIPGAIVLRDALFAGGFFVVINVGCRKEVEGALLNGRIFSALAATGLWSYSIYLTHNPIIVAVKQVALRLGLPIPAILLLRLVVAIGFGYLFHRFVERPFINTSRKRSTGAKSSPASLGLVQRSSQ